jgi:hypothetical protein
MVSNAGAFPSCRKPISESAAQAPPSAASASVASSAAGRTRRFSGDPGGGALADGGVATVAATPGASSVAGRIRFASTSPRAAAAPICRAIASRSLTAGSEVSSNPAARGGIAGSADRQS